MGGRGDKFDEVPLWVEREALRTVVPESSLEYAPKLRSCRRRRRRSLISADALRQVGVDFKLPGGRQGHEERSQERAAQCHSVNGGRTSAFSPQGSYISKHSVAWPKHS